MEATERVIAGGPGTFMTVRHLKLRGTNREIGRHLARLAAERHGVSSAALTADPLFARARRTYFERHYPEHAERMRGVAEAIGIDTAGDAYDPSGIFLNMAIPGMPGCSVVYYPPSTTDSKSGYLSRNYDFSTGSIADLMGIALPPPVAASLPAVMSEPYVMEWYPEDGGYASIAIHSFDLLAGTLDGMNSAGLAVSIMADEEALVELGPRIERHAGPARVVGLHELQVMRFLLDTCATADEAKTALLLARQYYTFVPCHSLVADRSGNSFIYENSTGRNIQHVIDGDGRPQVCTNFQVSKHPTPASTAADALTLETESFWRYRTISDRLAAHDGAYTAADIKENNACVNIRRVIDAIGERPGMAAIAAAASARTLWYSLYDQERLSVDFSFYLGEETDAAGVVCEQRSDYIRLSLDGA